MNAATALISGLRDVAPAYDTILCDVWGVVHNGRGHFAQACEALTRFRAGGGSVVLVTNAPRPHAPIREQLDRLGVPRAAFDDIVTSGDVTLALIAAHGNEPLHHIGPARDLTLFTILSEQTGLNPPRVALGEAAYVVCTGLNDDEAETPGDYDAALAQMRARSLDFICANPDIVVHVGDRLQYCSGALARRYEAAGGRVIQAGKPFAPIYERALALAAALPDAAKTAKTPKTTKPRILAIGDGMGTDIKGACGFGLDALFVAGGIHQEEVMGAAGIDAVRLEAFLQNAESRPKAAIDVLRW